MSQQTKQSNKRMLNEQFNSSDFSLGNNNNDHLDEDQEDEDDVLGDIYRYTEAQHRDEHQNENHNNFQTAGMGAQSQFYNSNNNHTQRHRLTKQNNYLQQQQQQHPTDIDLAEECQGLFVEYQTNRLNSLGGLEQLHTLNVTNCDSETLEEQINMLEATNTSTTTRNVQFGRSALTDDDQDADDDDDQFVSSNQDFLNLLFNGNNQDQVGLAEEMSLGEPVVDSRLSSSPLATQNNRKQTTQGKKRGKEAGQKATQTSDSTKKKANTKTTGPEEPIKQQSKITTTNTNRRLLPKSKNNAQAAPGGGGGQPKQPIKTSCKAGSTSTSSSLSNTSSNSSLSPTNSSSQQVFEYEQTPYKRQLDNLRKKLKMDVVGVSSVGPREAELHDNSVQVSSKLSGQCQVIGSSNEQLVGVQHRSGYLSGAPQLVNDCNAATNNEGYHSSPTIYFRTSNGLVPVPNGARLIGAGEFVPVGTQQGCPQYHPQSGPNPNGSIIFSSPIVASDCLQEQQTRPQVILSHQPQFVHFAQDNQLVVEQPHQLFADYQQVPERHMKSGHEQQQVQSSTSRATNTTKPIEGINVN